MFPLVTIGMASLADWGQRWRWTFLWGPLGRQVAAPSATGSLSGTTDGTPHRRCSRYFVSTGAAGLQSYRTGSHEYPRSRLDDVMTVHHVHLSDSFLSAIIGFYSSFVHNLVRHEGGASLRTSPPALPPLRPAQPPTCAKQSCDNGLSSGSIFPRISSVTVA